MAMMPTSRCGPDCWIKRAWEAVQDTPSIVTSPSPQRSRLSPVPEQRVKSQARLLYQRQPLQRWQTRLIALQAGVKDNPISCRLMPVDLIAGDGVGVRETGAIVQYEAISYSWGYPDFTMPMLCNDVEYHITKVMYDALQHFRLEDRERYLWIDAFCIDQYNEAEKSWQVKNMLMIFQKASGVIAWLGLSEPGEETLFAFIHQMEDTDSEDIGGEDIGGKDIGGKDIGGKDIVGGDHDTSCQAILAKLQLVMEDIFKRPWFQRTWVRQEIFAARSTQFQLGDHRIPLQEFHSGVEFLRNQGNNVDASKNFDILVQDSKTLRKKSPENITPVRTFVAHALGVLTANTFFQATDARDRIYGLLGMILDPMTIESVPDGLDIMQHPYPVDYGRSISSVYQDVIRYVIRASQDLEILHVFQDRRALASDLPSWVIDWRRCVPRYYYHTQIIRPAREQWRKTYRSTSVIPTDIPGGLCVQGRAVARVVSKSRLIPPIAADHMVSHQLEITCSTFHGTRLAHAIMPTKDSEEFERFLQECSYTGFNISWSANLEHYFKTADAHFARMNERLAESVGHFRALCSDLVQEGDLFVYLQGLGTPACLRRLEGLPEDRFIFLGPAIFLFFDGEYHEPVVERPPLLQRAFLELSDPPEREFILV